MSDAAALAACVPSACSTAHAQPCRRNSGRVVIPKTPALPRSMAHHPTALIGLTYKPSEVKEHGTLVLRSSNIQNDALAFDDNVFVDADVPERIMVKPGDVLVCAFLQNGESVLFFVL
jgi:hypothetical protein